MIVFYSQNLDESSGTLDNEEARHCMKVLRKKIGDSFTVVDGKGGHFNCIIESTTKTEVYFKIHETYKEIEPDYLPILGISLLKNTKRFDWFLEKACEIGVKSIQPLICHRTEKSKIKMERSNAIILTAMKQSLSWHLPELNIPISFEDFLLPSYDRKKFICHFNLENDHLFDCLNRGESPIILIGPEGDFTPNEIKLATRSGFRTVNISRRRLRTETAGIVATQFVATKNL